MCTVQDTRDMCTVQESLSINTGGVLYSGYMVESQCLTLNYKALVGKLHKLFVDVFCSHTISVIKMYEDRVL